MSRRIWILFATAISLALGAPAAWAKVGPTNVSLPANNSFLVDVAGAATPITVQGTAGGGPDDLICTYGQAAPPDGSVLLAGSVPVTGHAVDSTVLLNPIHSRACVLRIVPAGFKPSDPSQFTGPRLGVDELDPTSSFLIADGPNVGRPFDFYSYVTGFSGAADLDSISSCGVCDTYPLDPLTLRLGPPLFVSSAALFGHDNFDTRSEIQVDHQNAYSADRAQSLFPRTGGLSNGSGDHNNFPSVSYSQNIDPATGNLTAEETSDFVICSGGVNPAPGSANAANCPDFLASGVRLSRHFRSLADGRLFEVFDTFRSTDGSSHSVDLLYHQAQNGVNPAISFPWVSGAYSTHKNGDTIPAAPSGAPATISATTDPAAADGDEAATQGAITLSAAPAAARFRSPGSFETPFVRTVPAGGTARIGQAFASSFLRSDAAALSAQALSDFRPSIAIANKPASVNGGPASVTGTVTAGANDLPTSVSLNGVSVPVAADGSWTGVTPAGASSATATTTDAFGLTAQTQVAIVNTVSGPPFLGGAAPTASSAAFSATRFDGRNLLVGIVCNNAPCAGTLNAFAYSDGASIAKKHKQKMRRHRQLTIGSSSFSIAAGTTSTIKLPLSKASRNLLIKKRRLPIALSATLTDPGAAPSTTRTTTTIHPLKKKRKFKKH